MWERRRKFLMTLLLVLVPPLAAAPLSEKQKIDHLLRTIEQAGIRFIRNGIEYDGKKARQHMELKLGKAGGRIKTADQFITYLATKSSMTGRPYYVVLADGRKLPSATWLRGVLKELESKE